MAETTAVPTVYLVMRSCPMGRPEWEPFTVCANEDVAYGFIRFYDKRDGGNWAWQVRPMSVVQETPTVVT